jgi:hypothetical protein
MTKEPQNQFLRLKNQKIVNTKLSATKTGNPRPKNGSKGNNVGFI